MKKKKMGVVVGLLVCAFAAMLAFAACDSCGKKPDETDAAMLTFVAVDKSNFDKEITFTPDVEEGQTKYTYTYKLAVKLYDGGKMAFDGTCVKKAEATSGGNQGGGGFPGGGFPGGPAAVQRNAEGGETNAPAEELNGYNFKTEGTWAEEIGYGYTLNFAKADDIPSGAVVHTNFDTITGRHYFYADIAPVINGKRVNAASVQMEAKDSAYMKKLASDYKTYEERTATYMFSGGSGRTSVKIYLLPEGKVHMFTESGDSKTVVGGASWTEDKTAKKITLTVGSDRYTSAYCDIAGKEGYRITYSGADCFTNTSAVYVNEDFEGKTLYEFRGFYESTGGFPGAGTTRNDLTLTLTDKGLAVIRNKSGVTQACGEYTKDGENISVDIGKGAAEVTKEGGILKVTLTITVKTQQGPNTSTKEYSVEFTGGAVAAA